MTALLDHFLSLGEDKPKVLAAARFHEIFENNFLEESRDLAFAHMDVRIDREARDPEDQVTYLFQLIPGRSTSNFGAMCAILFRFPLITDGFPVPDPPFCKWFFKTWDLQVEWVDIFFFPFSFFLQD